MPEKTKKEKFTEWFTRKFGCGYGTGEKPVLRALQGFLNAVGKDDRANSYDYKKVEDNLGKQTTWLLINILSQLPGEIIEWGTSSRYGWLTSNGKLIRSYIEDHTVEELYNIIQSSDLNACHCDGDIHDTCAINEFLHADQARKILSKTKAEK